MNEKTSQIIQILVHDLINGVRTDLLSYLVQKSDQTIHQNHVAPDCKRFQKIENLNRSSLWYKSIQSQEDYYKSLGKKVFVQFTNCVDLVMSDKARFIARRSLSSSSRSSESMDYSSVNDLDLQNGYESNSSNMANFSETEVAECDGDDVYSAQEENAAGSTKAGTRGKSRFDGLKAKYEVSLCCECAMNNAFSKQLCRFLGWRKLMYDEDDDKLLEMAFLELEDTTKADNALWETEYSIPYDMDLHQLKARELKVTHFIGNCFSEFIRSEISARNAVEKKTIWKRSIINTRELCDACCTTIFNGHFCCEKCGFSVCLVCYNNRVEGLVTRDYTKEKDNYNWYFCSRREVANGRFKRINALRPHCPRDLVYVQYIPPHIINSLYEQYMSIKSAYKPELALLKIKRYQTDPKLTWFGSEDLQNSFMVLDSEKYQGNDMFKYFDVEWPNKRPILIKNLHKKLSPTLWTPKSFLEEFGELEVPLINCRNHKVVPDVKLKYFWYGFEDETARMTDNKLIPLILKLKDWPSSDDFINVLPSRFKDLMANLPISQYTARDSPLNLSSSLPDYFGKPDLGPKCYIAYGSIGDLKSMDQEGTTNLHLDISDAFNIMMYVGENKINGDDEYADEMEEKIGIRKMDKINQCVEKLVSFERAQYERFLAGERPGALWHLWHPRDAETVRKFLKKYRIEVMGKKDAELKNTDPIHDQINYIDHKMQLILRRVHNVEAFTILQFVGDAVFIPAGAPHQVRNLASCIKVACDFVSPQGIEQCLLITDQLRNLSDQHANHEDKLQVKNMVYHRIKESVAILSRLRD